MSALNEQVGGSHYKNYRIQPIEYIQSNGLNFLEGSVVKYVTRWRDKGGIEDLKKAKHMIDLMIEMESNEPEREGKQGCYGRWPAGINVDSHGQLSQ